MTHRFKFSTQAIRVLTASAIAFGLAPVAAEARGFDDCAAQYQQEGADRIPSHLKSLNLSKDQQEKLRAIESAHREMMRKNMALLKTNHAEESKLVEASSFDEKKAEKLAADSARIMEENNLATLRFRHQIYQILTPEQRAQFDGMRKQRGGKSRP